MYGRPDGATVYPYGPPAPYAPAPMYAPPRPARTPTGMRWSFVAFILYIGLLAVSALIGAFLFQAFGTLSGTPTPEQLTGATVGVLAGAVVLVILGILVLVFYFIAFGYLYGGRNEFGPAHARNVRLALYLMIAAIVTDTVGLIVGFILGITAVRTTGGFVQVNPDAYYLLVAAGSVIAVVVAAFVACMLVLSVRALARPNHQRLLYAAAGLGTATPGIVGAITLLQLPRFLAFVQAYLDAPGSGPPTFVPIDPSFGLPVLVGAVLGLVTFVLYVFVLRGVQGRFRSGELKPVLPPPAPSWMPAPVAPYPYPGVPAYPSYPQYPAYPPAPPQQPGAQGPPP